MHLQRDGRISQHDLSRAVGLSAPAVSDRLRKLEERGIIRGYTALLAPKEVGLDLTAFISVGMNGSRYYPEFRKRAGERDEVLECHSVTGEGSHLLKVRTQSSTTLEEFLAELQSWPGVQWTATSIALSTLKETSILSLERPEPEDAGTDSAHKTMDLIHVPFRHHTRS